MFATFLKLKKVCEKLIILKYKNLNTVNFAICKIILLVFRNDVICNNKKILQTNDYKKLTGMKCFSNISIFF